jgi:hypothetical protein
MPIERDTESTSFDHRPWGGQQRLVPLGARFARGTDAPETSEPAAEAPAAPAVTRPIAAAKRPAPALNPAKEAARPIVINPAKPVRPVINPPKTAKTAKAPAVTQPIVTAPVSRPATAPIIPAPAPIIPARPTPEDHAFREQPTMDSVPVARVSLPVEVDTEHSLPSLGTSAIMSALVEPMAMPVLTPVPGSLPPAPSTSLPTVSMRAADVSTDVNPAQPAFVPAVQYPAVAMYAAPTMYAPAVAVSSASRAPRSIPAFSVKEGRQLGGFVVPHLPKVCEVFRASEPTVAVRRRPLTARSIIAIPVGAVVATVAILMIYLAQPAQAKSAAPMASAPSKPQVMTVTAESVVMQTVPAPAAAPAPVVAEPVVVAAEPVAVSLEKAETPSKKHHRSKRSKRPRRIKAVDASTSFGSDALERP